MPTTVMCSLPDGDPCSGHSTMIGALVANDGSLLSHGDPNDMVEPIGTVDAHDDCLIL